MAAREFYLKRTISFFTLLVAGCLLCSCEKVVSVDLNQANPHIVIEGVVTDQGGPYTVDVTKTGDYFEPSLYFPPVSNATIVVTDNMGQRDALKEVTDGVYESSGLQGLVGRTYELTVFAEEKEYQASSSMPEKVFIDSLYAVPRVAFDGDRGYDIYVMFRDPPALGNYYRINVRSSSLIPADSIDGRRYRLYSDKLTNGNEMEERIRAGRNVNPGDTITVELLSIDKPTYDYFNTLSDILSSDRSPTSLSPANPNSNLSNGSLGYFAAYTIDSKSIVMK
jgi:hypothetical protein